MLPDCPTVGLVSAKGSSEEPPPPEPVKSSPPISPQYATGSKDESGGAIAARWTKYQFAAGEIIQFDIDSVTTLTNCILELTIRRTG